MMNSSRVLQAYVNGSRENALGYFYHCGSGSAACVSRLSSEGSHCVDVIAGLLFEGLCFWKEIDVVLDWIRLIVHDLPYHHF